MGPLTGNQDIAVKSSMKDIELIAFLESTPILTLTRLYLCDFISLYRMEGRTDG